MELRLSPKYSINNLPVVYRAYYSMKTGLTYTYTGLSNTYNTEAKNSYALILVVQATFWDIVFCKVLWKELLYRD